MRGCKRVQLTVHFYVATCPILACVHRNGSLLCSVDSLTIHVDCGGSGGGGRSFGRSVIDGNFKWPASCSILSVRMATPPPPPVHYIRSLCIGYLGNDRWRNKTENVSAREIWTLNIEIRERYRQTDQIVFICFCRWWLPPPPHSHWATWHDMTWQDKVLIPLLFLSKLSSIFEYHRTRSINNKYSQIVKRAVLLWIFSPPDTSEALTCLYRFFVVVVPIIN